MRINLDLLLEVRVASDQEHVPGDAILEHFLALDSVVAKCQEDPADVDLDPKVIRIVMMPGAVLEFFVFNERPKDSGDVHDALFD